MGRGEGGVGRGCLCYNLLVISTEPTKPKILIKLIRLYESMISNTSAVFCREALGGHNKENPRNS